MKFNLHNQVCARFKLVVHKGDGRPVRETAWFNNIVLDSGLNRMAVGTWIDRCCVGNANTTPNVLQTQLGNFLASTMWQSTTNTGIQTSIAPYYRHASVTWRFDEGVAAGNISEVGLGWGDSNLWNRALIKDINGNPTTITVLNDEYLDVVSEVRSYPRMNSSGSFNLLDKNNNLISSHAFSATPRLGSADATFSKLTARLVNAFSGAIVAITENPDGLLGGASVTTSNPTTTSLRINAKFDPNVAVGNHKTILVAVTGLLSRASGMDYEAYMFEIAPIIAKNSSQRLEYVIDFNWGRYEPT